MKSLNSKEFQRNVDQWIKDFDKTVSELKEIPIMVDEHDGNINHNYELILEVKEEILNLREDLKTLKLVQSVMLKEKLVK